MLSVFVMAVAAATIGAAQAGKGARRTITAATCAADLGAGAASKRRFCDVIVTSKAAESVAMTIPARTGAATLQFDLHNRFDVPAGAVDPVQAYVRQTAVVSVIRSTGELIERAAVRREYRTVTDLFDRIMAGRSAAVRAVAPGQPEPVRITIPAGVTGIGIVGSLLEVANFEQRNSFDTPGRAIALVSAMRIEYTPR